ncbi:MAG: LOG family protein [Merismopedia sp. SIO2A8]|nr:LOG family protein [Symploca sp. SIO2B6]NET50535.1 LOG family protein [Merismopedia sp. SIO2A8]
MTSFVSDSSTPESLRTEINGLLDQLPSMPHGSIIQEALMTLVRMAEVEADRLDWKILTASLQDMEQAFRVFYPYRHVRKITIFGSARIGPETDEYQMAAEFARRIVQLGFMVMTGAGGGIMQAGNEGAGSTNSFGLNIQLPFEQGSNPFIEGDRKLIDFKYFFTRKLFFLRETDALALFPGGFGTLDEAFECLTLIQTGKSDPIPLVLIDEPGRGYWRNWDRYIRDNVLKQGLISPEDPGIYTITDSIDGACESITNFYKAFHSSRYVDGKLVLRLKCELSDDAVEQLNVDFSDILVSGHILKSQALPQEKDPDLIHLPRLVMHFNRRDLGRLYQLIHTLNQMAYDSAELCHPEQR